VQELLPVGRTVFAGAVACGQDSLCRSNCLWEGQLVQELSPVGRTVFAGAIACLLGQLVQELSPVERTACAGITACGKDSSCRSCCLWEGQLVQELSPVGPESNILI
jgi:hypothetical protein